MKKYLLLFLGLSLLISCSIRIEKRLYNHGYYVDISSRKNSNSEKGLTTSKKETKFFSEETALGKSNSEDKLYIPVDGDFKQDEQVPDDYLMASVNSPEPIIDLQKNKNITESIYNENVSSSTTEQPDQKINLIEDQTKNENADAPMYLLMALMGMLVFGFVRIGQKKSLKMTRWANQHKIGSKVIIALLQIGMGIVGVMAGKELAAGGYQLSDNLEYIAGGIMALGFLSFMFMKKNTDIMVMRTFYLKKLVHLAIIIPFFLVTASIGNKLETKRQQISPLGYSIEKTTSAFYSNDTEEPAKADQHKNVKRKEVKDTKHTKGTKKTNGWRGLLALWIILYVLMAIGLIFLTCYLFCYGSTGAGVAVLLLTLAVLVIVPWLMWRWKRRQMFME